MKVSNRTKRLGIVTLGLSTVAAISIIADQCELIDEHETDIVFMSDFVSFLYEKCNVLEKFVKEQHGEEVLNSISPMSNFK